MLALITDENFDAKITAGVMNVLGHLDFVRAEDAGLRQTPDPIILEYAAQFGRLIVTHDVATMPGHAYERVDAGMRMPGVIIVPDQLQIGRAVEELSTLIGASFDNEWEGQVVFLPL
jgi:hypothetical protein